MNTQWCVRVIDKKAEKEHKSFFEVTDNFYVVAPTKQEARKIVKKTFELQDMVYNRDFALGSVSKYTGNGKSVGFVGDTFKCSLPHHTFIAYKFVNFVDSNGKVSKNDGKFVKYEHNIIRNKLPDNFHTESYMCSHGEFKQV